MKTKAPQKFSKLLADERVNDSSKVMLLKLVEKSFGKNIAFGTLEDIAGSVGISTTIVFRNLKMLREAGYVGQTLTQKVDGITMRVTHLYPEG